MFSGTSVIQSRSEQFSVAGEWVLPQVFYSSNWSIQEQSSHLQESSFFGCMDEVSVQHTSWKNNARANDHGEGMIHAF